MSSKEVIFGGSLLSRIGKARYYAQIVEDANAREFFKKNYENGECVCEMSNTIYDELGMKMSMAFFNILDNLANYKFSNEAKTDSAVAENISTMKRDLEGFIARVDKTMMEIYKKLEQQSSLLSNLPDGCNANNSYVSDKDIKKEYTWNEPLVGKRKKVPKEETRRQIKDAIERLSGNKKKLMLSDISKEAGIPYHKAVYACKGIKDLESFIG